MKTVVKQSIPLKSTKKPSPWDKAAGLLKSKKTIVIKDLIKSRKSWNTK